MKILIIILNILLLSKYVFSNTLFDTSIHDVNFVSNDIENSKLLKINEIKKNSILTILKKTLYDEKYEELLPNLSKDLINSFIKWLMCIMCVDNRCTEWEYFRKVVTNMSVDVILSDYIFNTQKSSFVMRTSSDDFRFPDAALRTTNNNISTKTASQ